MSKTPEQLLEEELASLTPEELDKYEMELRKMQHPEVKTSAIEAGARSAAQVMSFNFADEIEAGIDTAMEFVGEKEFTSLENLSNDYNKNLEEVREEYALNKYDHPDADTIGTGIGIGASMLIPGGAVAKGATLGAKAVSAAKIGTVYGAFAGAGGSEDKLSLEGALEIAEGALLGGVGGAVMTPAIAGVVKGGQAVGRGVGAAIRGAKKGVNRAAEAVGTRQPFQNVQEAQGLINRAFKGIGLRTQSQKNNLVKELNARGRKPLDWLKSIAKETDVNGDKLIGDITDSYTNMHTKAGNKIKAYGKERDALLAATGVKMSRQSMANDIKTAILKSKGTNTQDMKILDELVDDLVLLKKGSVKVDGNEVLGKVADDSPIDILELNEIRKNLDDAIKFGSVSNSNAVKKSLRTVFNDKVDSLVANKLGPDQAKLGQELRRKMSDLYALQDSLEKGLEFEQFGESAWMKEVFVGARAKMATAWMGEGVSTAAQVAGMGLRRLAVSPRVNRATAFNSLRAADALSEMSEKTLRRILLTADEGSIPDFNEILARGVAEADLKKNPMPRDIEEAIRRSASVEAFLNDVDKDLATSFRQAINRNDKEAIGQIMSELSDHPDAKEYIQEGMGWSGRVFNDRDKAVIEKQVRSSEYPAAEKARLLKELYKTGKIPVEEEIRLREPNNGKQRNKQLGNKVNYGFKKGYYS